MQIINEGIVFSADAQSWQRVACFPGLTRLADGRILCIFRIGRTKDSADETLRISESSDEGRTWQFMSFAPATTFGGVPGSFRLGHLIETARDHLLVIGCWANRQNPDVPIAHPETGGCLDMKMLTFRSTDGGATWSVGEEIPEPFPQPELSGPIVALAEEGEFLLPVENQKTYFDPAPIDQKACVLLSHDYGATWIEAVMLTHDPARDYWCHRITRLPDSNRLIDLTWAYDVKTQQDLPIHILHSSPDGRTWSEPQSTGVLGQLSTAFSIDDDTLLMGYVHRHQPASIRLRQSRDGGQSWDAAEELVIFSAAPNQPTDGSGGDIAEYYKFMSNYTFGWTPMVQLQNGNVLLAYFAGTTEATDIRWTEIAPLS